MTLKLKIRLWKVTGWFLLAMALYNFIISIVEEQISFYLLMSLILGVMGILILFSCCYIEAHITKQIKEATE